MVGIPLTEIDNDATGPTVSSYKSLSLSLLYKINIPAENFFMITVRVIKFTNLDHEMIFSPIFSRLFLVFTVVWRKSCLS